MGLGLVSSSGRRRGGEYLLVFLSVALCVTWFFYWSSTVFLVPFFFPPCPWLGSGTRTTSVTPPPTQSHFFAHYELDCSACSPSIHHPNPRRKLLSTAQVLALRGALHTQKPTTKLFLWLRPAVILHTCNSRLIPPWRHVGCPATYSPVLGCISLNFYSRPLVPHSLPLTHTLSVLLLLYVIYCILTVDPQIPTPRRKQAQNVNQLVCSTARQPL